MVRIIHFIGAMFLIFTLSVHFFLMALILSPVAKLVPITYAKASIIDTENLPKSVEDFLLSNKMPLMPIKTEKDGWLAHLNQKILGFRRQRLMNPEKALLYDLSLLNFGEGVVGIQSAANHYYKKSISELSESEWLTLVSLHMIFSK